MKNNLCKIKNEQCSTVTTKCSVYAVGLLIGLLSCQETKAQFVNRGDVKISDKDIVSIYMDYDNQASGDFVNDGSLYVFENWNNDGVLSYSLEKSGKTFFEGSQQQQISGSKISNFQNVVFDNVASLVPFDLKTTIKLGGNSNFKNGIIDASDYSGKIIFKENAVHSNAGNQSFVDGMVEKEGISMFQFPVGDEYFFRPSYHATNLSSQNAFTTQYFNQNSDTHYPHNSKDESILTINDQEYWQVTQDAGDEKIVLSLTLDPHTTPSSFFDENSDTQLAIVRWDENIKKWVNDGGVVSDPSKDELFSKLLTAKVSGYGIFTMAIVKKTLPPADDLIVYNSVSPNGDGINDSFHIKGIDKYPDNSVEIYNRWGVKVFDTKSYNESDNMFRGYSDGRATINRNEKLPTGTYFYILKYNNAKKVVEKSGYLYINNQ